MKVLRPAVKALVVHDGRFLAMHRSDGKSPSMELPGGGMEFGESAEQTIVREVREETGLNVDVIELLDTWDFIKEDLHITGVIYLCNVEGVCEVTLSDEHDSYQWLELDDGVVAEHINSVFKNQVIKYISRCEKT